jgi:hypothetical protein
MSGHRAAPPPLAEARTSPKKPWGRLTAVRARWAGAVHRQGAPSPRPPPPLRGQEGENFGSGTEVGPPHTRPPEARVAARTARSGAVGEGRHHVFGAATSVAGARPSPFRHDLPPCTDPKCRTPGPMRKHARRRGLIGRGQLQAVTCNLSPVTRSCRLFPTPYFLFPAVPATHAAARPPGPAARRARRDTGRTECRSPRRPPAPSPRPTAAPARGWA